MKNSLLHAASIMALLLSSKIFFATKLLYKWKKSAIDGRVYLVWLKLATLILAYSFIIGYIFYCCCVGLLSYTKIPNKPSQKIGNSADCSNIGTTQFKKKSNKPCFWTFRVKSSASLPNCTFWEFTALSVNPIFEHEGVKKTFLKLRVFRECGPK